MPISFTEESTATFPAPAAGGRMTFIDADGDGDMDILYQTGADGSPHQFARSNGDGTYTILALEDSPFAGLTLPNHNGGNFHVADIDGDGDMDLWAGANFTTGSYFRNDGGTFSAQSTASFPTVGASSRVLFGDFDDDGDADILYQTGANGTPFAYSQSNGDGTYTAVVIGESPFAGLTLPDHSGSNYYQGDFDGDGDDDLWVAVNNTTGSYFRNDGGSFSSQSSATLPAPAAAGRVAVADFDSDGDDDILYQTGANGSPWAYARSNGDGTFTLLAQADSPFAGVTFLDHNGSNILAEDVDGDGDHDLIITPNGGTGEFYQAGGKPPEIVSSTPSDGGTGVATTANITVVFDETVTKGSGNILIVRASDDTVVQTIDVNSTQVTGAGTTWTIDPSGFLEGLTGYYVLFDDGTFVDLDGSIFAGVDDPTVLNFTTQALTPPVFTNLNGDSTTFTEDGAPVRLDVGGNATVADAGQTNFAGGTLTVAITANGVPGEDVLRVTNLGTTAGRIGVSGANITYSGVVIGTFTGGTGGANLVITLDSDATIAATQALIRALQYNNTNNIGPSTDPRTVQITLADGAGATSAVQTVTVNVTAVEDATPGPDTLTGEAGADVIDGLAGNDVINGLTGNDLLYGSAGDDTVDGGAGNDEIHGGDNNDTLFGGSGVGADFLYGDNGDDVIDGGAGNDTLDGGAGADQLKGGAGNDTYIIDAADTVIEDVGQGTDTVVASISYSLGVNLENLTLLGSGALDGAGNALANTLTGGDGANRLTGGAGSDIYFGGAGADTFVMDQAVVRLYSQGLSLQRDTIRDFSLAQGDKIDLSGIDAIPGNSDDPFVFVNAFNRHAGQATLTLSGGNTILRLDVDGDGRPDHEVIIQGVSLTASDDAWIL